MTFLQNEGKTIQNKSRRTGIFVFVISMIICFLLLEVSLRLLTANPTPTFAFQGIHQKNNAIPDLPFVLIPNLQTEFQNVHLSTNSDGFRDDEFLKEKNVNVYRVLAIGDSYTFNAGVPFEQMWTTVLEQKLKEAGYRVEIYNMGVGMRSSLQYLRVLEYQGFNFQPDAVIWQHFSNDISTNATMVTQESQTFSFTRRLTLSVTYLKQHSYLYQHLRNIYQSQLSRFRWSKQPLLFDTTFVDFLLEEYEDEGQWSFFSSVLAEAAAQLEAKGVAGIFLYIPALDAVSSWEHYDRLRTIDEKTTKKAAEVGFESVVDTTSALQSLPLKDLVLQEKVDHHLNAVGSEILAKELADALKAIIPDTYAQ